jgi:hypothetical protein
VEGEIATDVGRVEGMIADSTQHFDEALCPQASSA